MELASHRKVEARLIGVPHVAHESIARLLASGRASWQGGKPVGAALQLSAKGMPVSEMTLEDR